MKTTIKTIAALSMLAFSAPAVAGGVNVYDDGDSKLKLEALFYLNTFQSKDDVTTAAGTTTTKKVGLAVDRAYFTAKYYMNDDWMMRLTTDMGQESALGKDQNIYLKYAYVEGKLAGKAAVLRVGQSHTPWIDYEQGKWKHRYVAKVMSDQYKFDTSADLGLGLKGKFADGMLDYFVTATNGSGYGKGTRTAGIDYSARLGLHPIKGLDIDFQYMNGYKGTKNSVTTAAASNVKSNLMQAMISYGTKEFRIGGNYLVNKDKGTGTAASSEHGGNTTSGALFVTGATGDEVKSTGYALWGWAKFGDSFGAFGRYEGLQNKNTVANVTNVNKEKVTRYVAGLEYSPIKNVTFAAVVDSTKLKNSAGVIANQEKDTRFGIYSQVKL